MYERRKAINAINRYIYSMFKVDNDSPQHVHSLEAAEELRDLILGNNVGSTFDIVDDYRTRMDMACLRSTTTTDRIIYSIKYDFATYVLDELLPFG